MTFTAEHIAGDDWRVFDGDGQIFKVAVQPAGTAEDAIAAVQETRAEPSADQIIGAAARSAKSRVRAAAVRAAAKIVGTTPDHEMTAWGTKADASTAYLAGTATARQIALIEIEATITGETVTELAETINAGATSKMDAVARLTGLRRVADAAIDADPANASDAAAAFEAAVSEHFNQ